MVAQASGWGGWQLGEREGLPRDIGAFRGDGYVHYLTCSDAFTSGYIFQNLMNFIL